MNPADIRVGIAYNEYIAAENNQGEHVSEETVKDMALDVFGRVVQEGFQTVLIPLASDLFDFTARIKKEKIDVLINLCEGFKEQPQREAHVAALLELCMIRYTGNPPRTLGLCQNKYQTKLMLLGANLPTANGLLATHVDDNSYCDFPAIVKPNNEDASLGIYPHSVVHNREEMDRQVQKILSTYNQPALVEQYIAGREFNVAVMELDKPQALPVSEIDFSTMPDGYPHICSYEAKWFEKHILFNATIPICPAPVTDAQRQELQSLAVKSFITMGCRDYARVDFRMDEQGRIFILEVNPNPDISLNAGYARALKAAHIEYGRFWTQLIQKTLLRKI
jgi:D-alanine-D-alanine ligase